uniref:MADF domain-containing protein n=1 Tax=Cacopsylla melanoneura TaxID=428564 RepID=A0A8D8THL6_9HEMI
MEIHRESWRDPDQLVRLINEFKIRPILWDSTQENYFKNKKQRQTGLIEIASIFDTTIHDIDRRWRNLRTIYRRELKKVLEEGQNGRPVKVKWFPYPYMNAFLYRVCVKEQEQERGVQFLEDLVNVEIEVIHH